MIGKILNSVNYSSIYCNNQTFNGLYRARKHSQIDGQRADYIFTNEKEFWNPPVEKIEQLGRCNDIGESLFYCSNNFETAILEVKPKNDEFVTVAGFTPILNDKILPGFNVKPNCIEYLKSIKGFESCIQGFDLSKSDKRFMEVDRLLNKLFTEKVNEEEIHKYKISIAITRCMMTDMIDNHGNKFPMNGMIYPSIVNNECSVNILLKPDCARNNFSISSLQTFKVLKVKSSQITIKLVRNLKSINDKEHPCEQSELSWYPQIDGPTHFIEY